VNLSLEVAIGVGSYIIDSLGDRMIVASMQVLHVFNKVRKGQRTLDFVTVCMIGQMVHDVHKFHDALNLVILERGGAR